MRTAPAALPTDPQALAQLCLSAFETIARLEKELAWHKRQAFGRKADVVPPPPFALDLFASEAPPTKTPVPASELAAPETITSARRKKGHGRKAFPAHLPCVIERVEPKDEERHCAC
jgi:hypothetical protein